MSKILKTFALLTIIYVVPLIGNAGLLLNLRVVLLMIASIIMFLTQPEMKVSEAKEKKSTDRNSIFIILLAGAISQIADVIEWGYLNTSPAEIRNISVVAIGVGMIVGGLAFRIWAIRTLGKFFTSTVQVREGHRVIQNGPYSIVRHPSYLGAFVAMVGSAVFMDAPVAAIITIVAMIVAYRVRIATEEQTLVEALGEEYKVYMKRTFRLIPCVW